MIRAAACIIYAAHASMTKHSSGATTCSGDSDERRPPRDSYRIRAHFYRRMNAMFASSRRFRREPLPLQAFMAGLSPLLIAACAAASAMMRALI